MSQTPPTEEEQLASMVTDCERCVSDIAGRIGPLQTQINELTVLKSIAWGLSQKNSTDKFGTQLTGAQMLAEYASLKAKVDAL